MSRRDGVWLAAWLALIAAAGGAAGLTAPSRIPVPSGYIFNPPDAKKDLINYLPISFQLNSVELWRASPAKVITVTKAGRKAGWRCE